MTNMDDINKRTVSINRTFDAPIKLVWEAWTEPGHIALWWGPKGMKTKVLEHDFKVGGHWKYSMVMPDGNDFISDGIYTVIEEHAKIFSTANFKPMTEGIEIQAIFEENGDKTNFTFNIVHPTEDYCKQQTDMGILNGWGSVFDRLKLFLESK